MKISIKKAIAKLGKKTFIHVAFSTHNSACLLGAYQPKEPECMRHKK
ncbi:cyclic lactone autoinducer peptide [Clostridium tyrobutyricum]|jgi:cyclic lactone autoinducer peptide|nr:cyclic lactone autoinducer peptide [Clostridium tyrobutyricum]MBV4418401.1 cyclic lactone autoinducer peptide [Clostridium tyrobutyricum]MBV4424745.1 cyclic lactone autoinducer peptide [Clostridium tyrobutyricum]MBV4436680.1 cyclic lactone autoinducer peptide [Clostridium tyrobutyricum]MEA5007646.1 cyclic lactone autoinducer peptide [Clostridium tyrobutyricum]